jgi:outer membrane protein assembly factor BamE
MTRSYSLATLFTTGKIANATLLLCSVLLISGCGNVSSFRFPGVYRIDIPQGNIITQDMVDQLRPGLNKRQVNFILGTPLIRDTFDQDRWDYLYSYQPGGGERLQERLVVFFEDGALVRFEGDFTQSPGKEQFGQATQSATNGGAPDASQQQ